MKRRLLSLLILRNSWSRALTLALLLAVPGCRGWLEKEPATGAETEPAVEVLEPAREPLEWALAIHGGAGTISKNDLDADSYYESLVSALRTGTEALARGAAAVEVVEAVVVQLEDDPRFNAGRGAVFTDRGTHELDAAIMDGRTLACGAVAAVKNVRNPITLARRVMERSPHVMLTGAGADEYAREVKVARAPQDYFTTERRFEQWQRARREARRGSSSGTIGTVGAVALDQYGNLAAATSTGGLTNKRYGRVGDTPIVGAGTYANNQTAALSATGKGEEFIRHAVAHDISSRIAYQRATLEEAASAVIHGVLHPGDGGVIGVDRLGNIALVFNSPGMFRGAADASGRFEVGIWEETRSYRPASTTQTR